MCVMELGLTVKTEGRKNFGDLSSFGFYNIGGSVSGSSQE